MTAFDAFISKLKKRKRTRFNESILSNKVPIPNELFYELLHFDATKQCYIGMSILDDRALTPSPGTEIVQKFSPQLSTVEEMSPANSVTDDTP